MKFNLIDDLFISLKPSPGDVVFDKTKVLVVFKVFEIRTHVYECIVFNGTKVFKRVFRYGSHRP